MVPFATETSHFGVPTRRCQPHMPSFPGTTNPIMNVPGFAMLQCVMHFVVQCILQCVAARLLAAVCCSSVLQQCVAAVCCSKVACSSALQQCVAAVCCSSVLQQGCLHSSTWLAGLPKCYHSSDDESNVARATRTRPDLLCCSV